jgi:hypothetical protein
MNVPVQRDAAGRVLSGSLNPGGRKRSEIEVVREVLGGRLPLFLERLAELTASSNESTRLAALREILDRLLGKPAVFVDATHTRVDVGALYLQALKKASEAANTIDGGVEADKPSTYSGLADKP